MGDHQTSPFFTKDDGNKGVIKASKVFFDRDCVLTVVNSYSDSYWVSVQYSGERMWKSQWKYPHFDRTPL